MNTVRATCAGARKLLTPEEIPRVLAVLHRLSSLSMEKVQRLVERTPYRGDGASTEGGIATDLDIELEYSTDPDTEYSISTATRRRGDSSEQLSP